MAEFIQNPRRSPRAPARCRTTVVSGQGTFEATTEDVGGHGCQLVSPRLVRKGEPVQLVVSHESMRDPLRVAGRVAWASDRSPWRLGIAYDDQAIPASQAWFELLLGQAPGLTAFKRVPERIPVDSVVYLASPPKFLADFTPDEVAILRSVGSGTSIAELRSLLRDRWQDALRALFSLLAHQHVTMARGSSVHPDAWRKILSEAESSLAIESLRSAPVPSPKPPAPAASAPRRGTPAPTPSHAAPAVPETSAPVAPIPLPVDAAAGDASGGSDWLVPAADMLPQAAGWNAEPAHAPAAPPPRGRGRGIDGGIQWSVTPPPVTGGFAPPAPAAAVTPAVVTPAAAVTPAAGRSAEAQSCYERALAELEGGRMAGALALLRRALALAPGDAEIAGAMARAMKRG